MNLILISHRGNIYGKSNYENEPSYLLKALSKGYNVEIDVWKKNNKYFLGHNYPIFEISFDFLLQDGFWIHCKDVITYLDLYNKNLNCFFQNNDEIVMTSKGYLWAHSRCKYFDSNTIVVCLNNNFIFNDVLPLGLCSDYIGEYKNV